MVNIYQAVHKNILDFCAKQSKDQQQICEENIFHNYRQLLINRQICWSHSCFNKLLQQKMM